MSDGLFQHLPGAHEMSGASGLASEPWLLPITDRTASGPATPEALLDAVRTASRRFWIGANTLAAVLALALTAQVATDWNGGARPTGNQVAEAIPPMIPAENASLNH